MSRYPWDEAPAWARYAATDEDGWRWWFGALPDPGRAGMWRLDPFEGQKVGVGARETTFCVNWRGSLEARPMGSVSPVMHTPDAVSPTLATPTGPHPMTHDELRRLEKA